MITSNYPKSCNKYDVENVACMHYLCVEEGMRETQMLAEHIISKMQIEAMQYSHILQLKARQGVQHTSSSQHHVNEEELEVKLS